MRRLLFFFMLIFTLPVRAQDACTLQMTVEGAIGPATVDYISRGITMAENGSCTSVLLLINTPGGNLQSTRLIVERILNTSRPVLCLVAPSGGHAGSAGAIILQACHVAGGMPATNIGAATPVSGGGDLGEDMRKKIVEDTKSWVQGLARLRGRNVKFAEEVITEAKALEAGEAARVGAIDVLSRDVEAFLTFAQGRTVRMPADQDIKVEVGPIVVYAPELRHRLLDFVAHPQIAYLVFMASLALLYFEITNPGTMVPGVLGGLGLVVSLISFHMLDIWWGGLLLILLGVALLVAELFIPSFGILGVGGIVAFIAGSILLFDPAVTGYQLPLTLVVPIALVLGAILIGMGYLALRSLKRVRKDAYTELVGREAEVVSLKDGRPREGMAYVNGELWHFISVDDVAERDKVVVKSIDKLTLTVQRQQGV